jgi:hypothetical protein
LLFVLHIQKNYAKIIVISEFFHKGVNVMNTYKLTAFEPNGEKLIDESFQAGNDDEAKEIGSKMLEEKGLNDKTHRCTSQKGKLILFRP